MHDLSPLTALGHETAQRDDIGALSIVENPDIALASVAVRRAGHATCKTVIEDMTGVPLPGPGQASLTGALCALWMGPDQFMLMGFYADHEMLAQALSDRLGAAASVTEQSDAWVAFDVQGETAVDLCERICAAPARRMQTGAAQRSTVHHIGCFIICQATGTAFRFIGPRSSAGSLHHALTTAAHSVA